MKSLKTNLMILILLLTILGSGLLFGIAIRCSHNSLRDVLESNMKIMLNMVSNTVIDKNKANFKLIDSVAHIPSIQGSEYSMFSKQDQLDSIANQDTSIIGFNLTDDQGNCRVREGGMVSFAERIYFQKAIKGEKYIFGPIMNKVTNTLTLFYASPLYDEKGEIHNTIFMPDNGGVLSEICAAVKVGEQGIAFIVDRTTGNTIGHPDLDVVLNFENLPQEIAETPKLQRKALLIEKMMNGEAGFGYYSDKGADSSRTKFVKVSYNLICNEKQEHSWNGAVLPAVRFLRQCHGPDEVFVGMGERKLYQEC